MIFSGFLGFSGTEDKTQNYDPDRTPYLIQIMLKNYINCVVFCRINLTCQYKLH